MRDRLLVEKNKLVNQHGQQERVAATITESMYIEAQVCLQH